MTQPRKKEILPEHSVIIARVGNRIRKLREEQGLSVEKFCVKNNIPRITYGNLENAKSSFQITTLLTVLDVYKIDIVTFIKSI